MINKDLSESLMETILMFHNNAKIHDTIVIYTVHHV